MSENKAPALAIYKTQPTVDVICVLNPFDTTERIAAPVEWAHDKSLAEYFDTPLRDYTYSVNGRIVPF